MACLLCLVLLRYLVTPRFRRYFEKINAGMRSDGPYYLLGLRLIPIFPFFIVNLVMGLTTMPLLMFYLISQAGMLPITVVYVNVGAQLGAITELSVRGVLTPGLIAGLVLLGVITLASRRLMVVFRSGLVCRSWRRRQPPSL